MPQTLLFWRRGKVEMGSTWVSDTQQFKGSQSHISSSLIRSQYCNLVLIFQSSWFHLVGSLFCHVSYPFHKKEVVYGTESFSQTVSCLQRFKDPNTVLYFWFPLSYSIHTDTLTLKMLWAFCVAIYNWLFQIEMKLTNLFTISPFLPWFPNEASMRKYS